MGICVFCLFFIHYISTLLHQLHYLKSNVQGSWQSRPPGRRWLKTLCSYRILCSVLLGTADNVIWQLLSFQVDAHWWEVKGIKSYLQCMEGAKIWQKQLSPSWMGYPPVSSKSVISQHSVSGSGTLCML